MAAFGDLGIIAIGGAQDKILRLGDLRRLADLVFLHPLCAPGDIFTNAAGKQFRLLLHQGYPVPQGFHGEIPHIHPVHQHGPFRGIVKSGDQVY